MNLAVWLTQTHIGEGVKLVVVTVAVTVLPSHYFKITRGSVFSLLLLFLAPQPLQSPQSTAAICKLLPGSSAAFMWRAPALGQKDAQRSPWPRIMTWPPVTTCSRGKRTLRRKHLLRLPHVLQACSDLGCVAPGWEGGRMFTLTATTITELISESGYTAAQGCSSTTQRGLDRKIMLSHEKSCRGIIHTYIYTTS